MASSELGRPAGSRIPVVEAIGVSKSFPGVRALDDVTLRCDAGSIHALVGENGAGKSTLMKILAGAYQPDRGEIRVRGSAVTWAGPSAARRGGISTVFQELTLVPDLSIAENVFLGAEPVRRWRLHRPAMEDATHQILEELGGHLPPQRPVRGLSVAQQQLVAIAKGLVAESDLFIFDEPTAALSADEVQHLFAVIRRLQRQGKAILYCSHRLAEVFALADTVTVLKDGRCVGTMPIADATPDGLVTLMVGREIRELYPPRPAALGGPALVIDGLVAPGVPGPIDLTVRRGEIVGLAGLEGQGQRELLRALFGLAPRQGGRVMIDGGALAAGTAREMIRQNLGLLPGDRRREGLVPGLTIGDNILLGPLARRPLWAWVPDLTAQIESLIHDLAIRATSPRQLVEQLSGGNQQKVLLGRWLATGASVLLCEEPTRGIDVGAKAEVYRLLRRLTEQGAALLVLSRDMPELLGLCDTLAVMYAGRLIARLPAREATEAAVMRAALGDAA